MKKYLARYVRFEPLLLLIVILYEPRHEKTGFLHMQKKKMQISFAVTAKLISIFVFRYTDSTIPLLSESGNFKPLAIFYGCTARFVLDLVENPEDQFSRNEAHIYL